VAGGTAAPCAIVEGRRVAYRVTGPAGGLPIVFVHGLAASKAAWSGVVDRLPPELRAISYDLRGHGESDPMPAPCTRSDLARELVAVLDAAGAPRAVLVGHSAGGVIAMQTAVDAPTRVGGLVLIGTASACNDRTAEWYAASAEKARNEGGAAGMRSMGVRGTDVPVPDGVTFAEVAHAMRTLNRDPLTERLKSVEMPTLILVGEKDFLGAGGSVILSRTIRDSELEILSERGHGIHVEDPAWLAGRVSDFARRRCSTP
jgi:3-oxoadipate enol-lactonase